MVALVDMSAGVHSREHQEGSPSRPAQPKWRTEVVEVVVTVGPV